MGSRDIPMATVVDYDFTSVARDIKYIKDGLSGLNILNVIGLQKSVSDLGTQLLKMHSFNENTAVFADKVMQMTDRVSDLTKMLEPLSRMAHEKMESSIIEATLKDKHFMLELARTKAEEMGIPVSLAYEQLSCPPISLSLYVLCTMAVLTCGFVAGCMFGYEEANKKRGKGS
jgi:hypothetical protein